MNLIAILVGLIILCLLLWGCFKILSVTPVPEPFKTIIWVVVVIIGVLIFLQISGLYHFSTINTRVENRFPAKRTLKLSDIKMDSYKLISTAEKCWWCNCWAPDAQAPGFKYDHLKIAED